MFDPKSLLSKVDPSLQQTTEAEAFTDAVVDIVGFWIGAYGASFAASVEHFPLNRGAKLTPQFMAACMASFLLKRYILDGHLPAECREQFEAQVDSVSDALVEQSLKGRADR